MEIQSIRSNGINVLVLSGAMRVDRGRSQLQRRFIELFETGERCFVFDLRNVTQLDSAAMGEIIACQKQVDPATERIRLVVDGKSKLYDFVKSAHLDRVFRVFTDDGEALSSFSD